MRKIGRLLLRLLLLLGLLALCYVVTFSFLVLNSTKGLGVVFLAAGLWGILEMAGVVKRGPFQESRSGMVIGTIGAIIAGLYFLLR